MDDEADAPFSEINDEQLLILDSNMKAYDGVVLGKKQFEDKWNELAFELNSIGPPRFTSIEWQKKSSDRKRKQTKRKVTFGGSERVTPEGQLTNSKTEKVATPVCAEIVKAISAVADKQDIIIKQQDILINLQEKTNRLLEEIVKKDQSYFENQLENGTDQNGEQKANSESPKTSDFEKDNASEAEVSLSDDSATVTLSTLPITQLLPTKLYPDILDASTEKEYECNLLTCSTKYHAKFRTPFKNSIHWIMEKIFDESNDN